MVCPKCNRQLSATAIFCPSCGTKIARQDSATYTQNGGLNGYNRGSNISQQATTQQTSNQVNVPDYSQIYNNHTVLNETCNDNMQEQLTGKNKTARSYDIGDILDKNNQKYVSKYGDVFFDEQSEIEQNNAEYNEKKCGNDAISVNGQDGDTFLWNKRKVEDVYCNEDELYENQNNESEFISKQGKSKKKKVLIIIGIAVIVIIIAAVVLFLLGFFESSGNGYDDAIELMNSGKYAEAITEFEKLDGYKDSDSKIEQCKTAIQYNDALSLMQSGKYDEAINAFEALGSYSDSAGKINECRASKYKAAEVGTYVNFGTYEQDNDTSNGKESIEWLVLEVQEDKILVISKYGIDRKPYNEEETKITWEKCSMRSWLNKDFIDSAFSDGEKALLISMDISNAGTEDSANGGNDTQDKVFLLSIDEIEKYFKSDEERLCQPTAYVVAQGAYVNYGDDSDSDTCWWWLRTPGKFKDYASGVNSTGYINAFGDAVNNDTYSVRPALWINLKP